ncbi:MAG TPA: DUF3999 family protein [Kiritimatiellia bacterium]|jgi:hypothetical protein|nr:MAG: hypothetical protein BWX54_01079 [Verrucomicrobia bacterium ADurb.Bin018]HOE00436.1 DUF3999 family protein [Kiritimatiellia bacterium]HOU59100.1 DUF3999 family protein [Kiritimatiellia bacterium]HPV47065.1 DUF3999 family protein [Kiritimatiellia bacterium]HQF21751.1 DUF3999 family protein [Kiritimatiellia bacterium]
MKRLVFASLLIAATMANAVAPADFGITRNLFPVYNETDHLAELRLDAAVCALTQPGFTDVRLFTQPGGQDTPYVLEAIRSTREQTRRINLSPAKADLRVVSDQITTAFIELPHDAPPAQGLEVRTPQQNFVRNVRISGSEDNQFWRPLAEAAIFDFSQFINMRRTEIPLPANSCRFFSIEIVEAGPDAVAQLAALLRDNKRDPAPANELLKMPFHTTGINLWNDSTTLVPDALELQEWPPVSVTIAQDKRQKITEIIATTLGAPITRFEFDIPPGNFSRIVTVQVSAVRDGKPTWRTVGDGILSSTLLPDYATNQLTVTFPEQRSPQMRLVVQNANSAPLNIAGVRAYGPTYRLFWISTARSNYTLAYHNDQVAAPAFDDSAIRAALAAGEPADLWHLHPAALPEYKAPRPILPLLQRPSTFIVLAGIVLLVLGALYARMRK